MLWLEVLEARTQEVRSPALVRVPEKELLRKVSRTTGEMFFVHSNQQIRLIQYNFSFFPPPVFHPKMFDF